MYYQLIGGVNYIWVKPFRIRTCTIWKVVMNQYMKEYVCGVCLCVSDLIC